MGVGMSVDDIIYLALLLGCIGFGTIYRHLDNERVNRKRWIGSGIGLLLMLLTSGYHIVHILFTFSVSTLITLAFDVRQGHVLCFIFMFGYLFVFRYVEYFHLPAPPGSTNLIQMAITLKMVGLAFERNTAATDLASENQKTFTTDEDRNISAIKKAYWEDILDLNVEDVFHYSFNYIGLLTGPYYSYRTFRDYFTARYWQFINCELLMMQRLKWAAVYSAFFLSCSYIWPISYALSDEFYFERSFLYRLWYVWPSFFIFRMRIYVGMTLTECICIMAGLGAYPQAFRSRPGGGPREVVALDQPIGEAQFDFETIHNFDAETTEKCLTVREAMRSFHMCTQYWMATVVYHRLPFKRLRTVCTLAVSAFWHGTYPGYYSSMLGAVAYLPAEALWDKLVRQSAQGTRRQVVDLLLWLSKSFVMAYLAMSFLLMTTDKIWTFYQSVYHVGLFWLVGTYVVGLLAAQQAKMMKREGATATPVGNTVAPPPTKSPAPSPAPLVEVANTPTPNPSPETGGPPPEPSPEVTPPTTEPRPKQE